MNDNHLETTGSAADGNPRQEARVAVLGVGNVLVSDEGFGVHMIDHLTRNYAFEPEIQLIDGGTSGMELLGFIKDFDKLLLLDCTEGKGEPGSLYFFDDDAIDYYFNSDISAHEVGIQDIFYIHGLDENAPKLEVKVIGCQPASLEIGMELSPEVMANFPKAVELAITQLENWGITATKIDELPLSASQLPTGKAAERISSHGA